MNELKGFRKVFLKAGEAKEVTIRVNKSDFAYYNIEMKKAVEDGAYLVKLARNAQDIVNQQQFYFER